MMTMLHALVECSEGNKRGGGGGRVVRAWAKEDGQGGDEGGIGGGDEGGLKEG